MKPNGQYPNARGHRLRGTDKPKRSYPTRWAARKAVVRRIALDMVEMGTYPCTSGNRLHYHFGHSSPRQRWESWKQLQRYRLGKYGKRPYYTLRLRLRFLFTGKIHKGAHIERG